MAYNPVTGQSEIDTRFHDIQPAAGYERTVEADYGGFGDPQVESASYCASCECGDEYCSGGCGCGENVACGDMVCGDAVCGDVVGCSPVARWYAGFEATFVKPHFGDNVAFTVTDNNGSSTTISDTQFDYDLEFSPRVFVGWNRNNDVGFRATWWHFDHSASTAMGSPPSSGLGELSPPAFADVDISSTVPTDVYVANTDLNAYTIDLEATKSTAFCAWQFGMGCGFRYAYAEQGYVAELSDGAGDPLGAIDFRHSIEGFGPTVSLEAFRPYGCRSGIFCKARGSLLFGDAKSRLIAGEDLNLTTPFDTTQTTANDDLLSIGELQVGYRWHAAAVSCRPYQPFCSVAMEGQVWNGAGNASSQDGMLGFFGFNSAIGINW